MVRNLSQPISQGYAGERYTPAYGLTLIAPPSDEPVSVVEAKRHSRISIDDDDSLIEGQLMAARLHVENLTGLQLCTATWKWSGTYFPCVLPRPPLQSILAVKYVATDGTLTTFTGTNYQADILCRPARIEPAYGQAWPTQRSQDTASVFVEYVAGFGAPEDVPANIKHAILLLFGWMYENREPAKSELMAINALLSPESVLELV